MADTGQPPILAVTWGEPAGIGPDTILQAAEALAAQSEAPRLIVYGDPALFASRSRRIGCQTTIKACSTAREAREQSFGGLSIVEIGTCPDLPGELDPSTGPLTVEALTRALDIAFDARGARRVYADIDPDNAPSLRLFERVGFQYEGRLRATYETHIGVRDSIMMSLLESDPKPWRR